MKAQLKTLFASILLLIALCFGAFASVGEKHALGDFSSTQQYIGQNEPAIQLVSLGNFASSAETASECCNAPNTATIGGKTCVYSCVVDGKTRYVGITDDIKTRGQAHLREKGIVIDKIDGLENLSRADARAVEQTLINYHGLGKNGGTLINKINSISATKNPTAYEQSLLRGAEILKQNKYPGF